MQIVIEISEKLYNDFVLQAKGLGESMCDSPSNKAKYAIANGTPLSKEWDCNSCPWSDSRKMYNEGIERGLWMQEQVIEDIKQEIEDTINKDTECGMRFNPYYKAYRECLQIINKYIGKESE